MTGTSSRSSHLQVGVVHRDRITRLAKMCNLGSWIEPVVGRLEQLIPVDSPRLLHGDLWWGNVVWGPKNEPFVIDPSHHFGHPEEDLAMLALFSPMPSRVLDSYLEVRPLEPRWKERVGFWQLYPLLVHCVLFGGAYVSQAKEIAKRYS